MTAPRRRRTNVIALAIVVVLTLVLVAVVVRVVATASSSSKESQVVAASSASLGHPAVNAVEGGDTTVGWQPVGEPVGAWWQVSWAHARPIAGLTIAQPASGSTVTRAMLVFGNGTRVMTPLRSGRSNVAFTPRSVDSIRIVLVATRGDVASVALLKIATTDRIGPGTPSAVDPSAMGIGRDATVAEGARTVRSLTDGTGPRALGDAWTSANPGAATVTFRWGTPQEVDAVVLYGATPGAGRAIRAEISFGADLIRTGGVLADPSRPTQVAFVPRVTRSLSVRLFPADDSQPVRLDEIRLLTPGTVLTAPAGTSGTRLGVTDAPAPTCNRSTESSPPAVTQVVLRCPTSGTSMRGFSKVVVAAPAGTTPSAQVWGNDGAAALTATVSRAGGPDSWALEFDAARLAPGPFTLSVSIGGAAPSVELGFYNVSGPLPTFSVRTRSSIGGRLVYSEEFDGDVTVSRDGSRGDYTAAKPEVEGVSDFGDAPFADPATADSTLSTIGGSLLRMDVRPQTGAPGRYWGSMLASSRAGGSGFSAQYGYFETRLYTPIAIGSWPAFWVLPSPNLAKPQSDVAEFDAVEMYGHDPRTTCSSTHHFHGTDTPGGVADCGGRFPTVRAAAAWHVFGVRVSPDGVDFFIDGRRVAQAQQVPGGAEPLFFLVDLAIGGGWPVDLTSAGGDLQLYVDYVRVYE